MSGSLIQLVTTGHSNNFISGLPEFTYFKKVYKKYVNFSIKQIKNTFSNGIPQFGKNNCEVILHKDCDFIIDIFLKLKITSNNSNTDYGNWNYIRNFGFSFIKKVYLKIGNQLINTLYSDYLNVWYNLLNDKQKKLKLDKLIGNNEESLSFNSKNKNLDLNIPIPFFYDNNILAIHNLLHHEITLLFEFQDLNKLINKQEYYFDKSNSINSNPDISNQTYDIELKISECELITENILIEPGEHDKFDENEILIETNYFQEEIIDIGENNPQFEIFPKNSSKYIIMGIKPSGFTTGNKYLASPGKDFYLNAAKRFCLRYTATGWIGGDDSFNNFGKFGIFTNDSGVSNHEKYKHLVFDHGLTSLKTKGEMTEYEIILYNLFNKLRPNCTRIIENNINAIVKDIEVDISKLTIQDKYILSLPTNEIDALVIKGGNTEFYVTGDNNNEGNPNYDIKVYDNISYCIDFNNEIGIIKNFSLFFNNNIRVNEYDSILPGNIIDFNNKYIHKNGLILYSFSLDIHDINPKGVCNFSVIDKIKLLLKLNLTNNYISSNIYDLIFKNLKNNSKLIFISKNYNILKYNNGMVHLKYY